ncbi:hypothetical protein [Pseudolabrys sp. FHR47]|uniref:hypothetical protein n=1 Tax=Pseudolabrys sp. FHR47 TaxID=2562284 RepID=UPI0010BF6006|nr:hypothetical protein [Pseudolabrys sp. FHR47]
MRIEAAKHLNHQRLDMTTPDESRQGPVSQESGDAAEPGRALVATGPQPMAEPAPNYRQATFLAQLIATRDHAPQTRERRRAEPVEALAAYRATAALV